MAAEVYGNTFYRSGASYQAPIYFRAGTALIHDNTFTGNWQNLLKISDTMRAGSWGSVDGTQAWDGNCQAGSSNINATAPADCGDPGVPYATGYPMLDNIGRAQASTGAVPGSPGAPSPLQPQELKPFRVWNNTGSGIGGGACNDGEIGASHEICNAGGGYITQNLDIYFSTDTSAAEPGYTAYTYPHPYQSGGSPPAGGATKGSMELNGNGSVGLGGSGSLGF